MRAAKVLAVIFGILTICGAVFVLSTGGRATAVYALVPMVFCLMFAQLARSKETKNRKPFR